MSASSARHILFGPHKVPISSIFYESELCYGIVNLKPITPGHVLLIPKRVVPRFAQLSEKEATDLYLQCWKIAPVLERHYGASALNIAQQDGESAGQSVPHVHVHLLPRKKMDFEQNDEVYDALENQELGKAMEGRSAPASNPHGGAGDADVDSAQKKATREDVFDESKRKIRTEEEMATEAQELRALFVENTPNL